MIIIAGTLHVQPSDRDRYLAGVADVTRRARATPGCLDFTQAADPLDPARITVFERWESDDRLDRFRAAGAPPADLPPLRGADVHKYRISSVEAP
ncbi:MULTISPECIES: putative quinol monooxygenase [Catenuloplanes]|uniref:Quinol monooxygenase YgiN n=1 Tax=Catenuloplanes niger TaxID=587534 RepID=A0AAE3ZWJ1_9ACTN|nr:antibiotic biosynthesis monooxygenase [Catenuloplanes niger]MDR7327379.1 quinol monooxygenase YgiN [Catenuloplanes niger]